MKKLQKWTAEYGRMYGVIIAGAAFSMGLLLLKLGGLPGGISQRESTFANFFNGGLSAIAHNPVGLPLNLLHWLVGLLPLAGPFWLRLPSVVFAALTTGSVAYVLRRWYGPRTALFGFVLFAASAWVLHVGRLATSDILFLTAIPVLLASHLLLHERTSSRPIVFLWLLAQLSLLYIPGMIWLLLINAWLQRIDILTARDSFKTWVGKLGAATLALALIAPLVVGLIIGSARTISLGILGLPTALPTVQQVLHNAGQAALFISIRGQAPDDIWLNHLPILDAFLTVTLVAGVIFYAKHLRAARTRLIGGLLLFSFVLSTLGGAVTVGLLVPLLYLVAAAGIAYLLHLWLAVFPRNPLARGLGIGLVSLAVALSCLYGIRQYFVAWPHHPATKSAFNERGIPRSHL